MSVLSRPVAMVSVSIDRAIATKNIMSAIRTAAVESLIPFLAINILHRTVVKFIVTCSVVVSSRKVQQTYISRHE